MLQALLRTPHRHVGTQVRGVAGTDDVFIPLGDGSDTPGKRFSMLALNPLDTHARMESTYHRNVQIPYSQ